VRRASNLLTFLLAAWVGTLLVLACEAHAEGYRFADVVVERVLDGDTFEVTLQGVHPLFGDRARVRLLGVNAGETRGARCAAERQAGIEAKAILESRLGTARRVDLLDVSRDNFGRLLARVVAGEVDMGELLVSEGAAVRWDGRGDRPVPWCS
jgi:endonuclease YncB( thermonuclease family)